MIYIVCVLRDESLFNLAAAFFRLFLEIVPLCSNSVPHYQYRLILPLKPSSYQC